MKKALKVSLIVIAVLLIAGITTFYFLFRHTTGQNANYIPADCLGVITINSKTIMKDIILEGGFRGDSIFPNRKEKSETFDKLKNKESGFSLLDDVYIFSVEGTDKSIIAAISVAVDEKSELEEFLKSLSGGTTVIENKGNYSLCKQKKGLIAFNEECALYLFYPLSVGTESVLAEKANSIFSASRGHNITANDFFKKDQKKDFHISCWFNIPQLKKSGLSPDKSISEIKNAAMTVLFKKGKLETEFIQEYDKENSAELSKLFQKTSRPLPSNSGETAVLHVNLKKDIVSYIFRQIVARMDPKLPREQLNSLSEVISGEMLVTVGKKTTSVQTRTAYEFDDNFNQVEVQKADTIKTPEFSLSMTITDDQKVKTLLDSLTVKKLLKKQGETYLPYEGTEVKFSSKNNLFTAAVGNQNSSSDKVKQATKFPVYFSADIQKAMDIIPMSFLFQRYTSAFKTVTFYSEHYGESSQKNSLIIQSTLPEENFLITLIRYYNRNFKA